MKIIKLINDDCLQAMKDIADKSIDMIFTDLPYGITACRWDSVIPFEPLWKQYNRIIKDNGTILLTATQPFATKVINSNPNMFRYEWIWEKEQGTNFLMAKKQPLRVHENILVFYKKLPKYNPQFTQDKPYYRTGGYSGEISGQVKKTRTVNTSGKRYPRTIQKFQREVGYHPTQKPVDLVSYFIKTYTDTGDVVLDSCMGSGTTGIACRETDRSFIGIELEERYFKIAEWRIMQLDKKVV